MWKQNCIRPIPSTTLPSLTQTCEGCCLELVGRLLPAQSPPTSMIFPDPTCMPNKHFAPGGARLSWGTMYRIHLSNAQVPETAKTFKFSEARPSSNHQTPSRLSGFQDCVQVPIILNWPDFQVFQIAIRFQSPDTGQPSRSTGLRSSHNHRKLAISSTFQDCVQVPITIHWPDFQVFRIVLKFQSPYTGQDFQVFRIGS